MDVLLFKNNSVYCLLIIQIELVGIPATVREITKSLTFV